jgi:hypothetical protein
LARAPLGFWQERERASTERRRSTLELLVIARVARDLARERERLDELRAARHEISLRSEKRLGEAKPEGVPRPGVGLGGQEITQRNELGRAIAERLGRVGEHQQATSREALRSVHLRREIPRRFRLSQREQRAGSAERRVRRERPIGEAGTLEIGESTRGVSGAFAQSSPQESELRTPCVERSRRQRALKGLKGLARVAALERRERLFEPRRREQRRQRLERDRHRREGWYDRRARGGRGRGRRERQRPRPLRGRDGSLPGRAIGKQRRQPEGGYKDRKPAEEAHARILP